MSPRKEDYNRNWEAEIAAYDAERTAEEKEYNRKHVIVNGSANTDLTPEENEVFDLILRGIPIPEIAEQFGVEEDVIAGLVEIIRAKLSMAD